MIKQSELLKEEVPIGMLERVVPEHDPVVPGYFCQPFNDQPHDGVKMTTIIEGNVIRAFTDYPLRGTKFITHLFPCGR